MLAFSLALCLLPQEARATGRVIDLAGKPVANASVTLLHREFPRDTDPAREHRIVVSTDDRGVFRAALTPDRTYSAWAASADAASLVAEGVESGTFVELQLAPASGARVVMLPDLYLWPDAATFRYRAVVGSERLDYASLPCSRGELALPPLPPLRGRTIEVLRADGEVLWAAAAEPTARGFVLHLPPPVEVEVVVLDASGAAVPDASVHRCIGTYAMTASDGMFLADRMHTAWSRVGATDAAGRLTFRTPMPLTPKPNLWLLTAKAGWTMSLDGRVDGKRFAAGDELPAPQQGDAGHRYPVTLAPAAAESWSLRREAGGAWATGAVHLTAGMHIRTAGDTTDVQLAMTLPLVDGIATPPCALPPTSGLVQGVVTLTPLARTLLRQRLGETPPAEFRLPRPWSLRVAHPEPVLQPDDWHLLRVTMADGRPAARTVVFVHGDRLAEVRLLRTDYTGRAMFEQHGDTRVTVFSSDGCGSTLVGARDAGPTDLVLQPMHRVVGEGKNADGSPARGACVQMRLAGGVGCEYPQDLAALTALSRGSTTGDDGRFELVLPPFATQLQLRVIGREPGTEAMATIDWDPKAPSAIAFTLPAR